MSPFVWSYTLLHHAEFTTTSFFKACKYFGWVTENKSRFDLSQMAAFFSKWETPTWPLTSTDAPGQGHVVAIVTLQSFVVVAGPSVAAVLVELCGAHLAAATSVWNGANTRGAHKGLRRALTHYWAAGCHLEGLNKTQKFAACSSKTSHKSSKRKNVE